MCFSVLYQDTSIIVVNKTAGIPVIRERGKNPVHPLKERLERSCDQALFTIHRIDKDTSGIVVFAKDSESHKNICEQFENRKVTKSYLALVLGITPEYGRIDTPIYRFGSGRMGTKKGGKESLTAFETISSKNDISLVSVTLHTGRRHQIRVHFYSIGNPILGDSVYGEVRPVGGVDRLMLHAAELTFIHPDGRQIDLKAETHTDWNNVIKKYGIE